MSLMGDLFTVFADNLLRDMDAGWLRQIFSSFGRVVDVFIPLKRSSGFKTKFGFIRFKKKEEATCAIDALDGLLIRNFRILVQFAKYPKSTPSTVKSFQKIQVGDHNGNLVHSDHRWIPKSGVDHPKQSTSGPPFYADILRGGSKVTRPKLVGGIETDVDWLRKSAVGRLINYCDVNTLQDLLISNGIWNAHVRSIGGLNVLISFDSVELLNSFLLEKDNLLPKWFSTVEAWNNQTIKASRCVWISCYGVPLKAWCSSIEIGKLWGAIIRLDEMTENLFAFDKGRMLLLTDFLDCINEVADVIINGVTYPVKVVEDPMAETSLENRVFSSVKIKKGNSNDGKEGIIQIDPGDDAYVHEVRDEGIGGELKADMLDVELAFKQNNFVENCQGTQRYYFSWYYSGN